MSDSRSVIVCGGGIVGFCAALYLARAGFAVTLLERNVEGADSCAYSSAGYISPSHLAPIAAPGMVWQGLKWMLSSRSPFTQRAAPVLRDLCLAARQLFVELAEQTGNAFELRKEGFKRAKEQSGDAEEVRDGFNHRGGSRYSPGASRLF